MVTVSSKLTKNQLKATPQININNKILVTYNYLPLDLFAKS